jgi:hypothetical protein
MRALKNNGNCFDCNLRGHKFNVGRVVSDITKEKMSISKIGKLRDEETKLKISNSKKDKPISHIISEKTREKMRINRLNQIKSLGNTKRMYNPKACEFIDKLNKERGWNLQHALNGGEVMISGYSVDGYDKDRNIIFEYDEPNHHYHSYKQKDLVRQQRLIDKIKPLIFLRYDEKLHNLYEVIL